MERLVVIGTLRVSAIEFMACNFGLCLYIYFAICSLAIFCSSCRKPLIVLRTIMLCRDVNVGQEMVNYL